MLAGLQTVFLQRFKLRNHDSQASKFTDRWRPFYTSEMQTMHEIPQRLHCFSKGQCKSTKSFGGVPMNVLIVFRRAAQDKQTPTTRVRPLLLNSSLVVWFIVLSSILQGNVTFPWQRRMFRLLSHLKPKVQKLSLHQWSEPELKASSPMPVLVII